MQTILIILIYIYIFSGYIFRTYFAVQQFSAWSKWQDFFFLGFPSCLTPLVPTGGFFKRSNLLLWPIPTPSSIKKTSRKASPMFWLHIPKCGTSFYNTVLHMPGACPGLGANVSIDDEQFGRCFEVGIREKYLNYHCLCFFVIFDYLSKPQGFFLPNLNQLRGCFFFLNVVFFPKDVSSQGPSEDCWRISHHTYPTHIHSTRIPPIRIPPIRIRSIRIPPIRIHSIRIHSMRIHSKGTHVSCEYVSFPYVSMQCVSIQCVSIQKVCISRNGNVCECKTYPCISLHQQEWQWVWVSLHVISYHCYSAGMAMKIKTLLFLQFKFFATLLTRAYEHGIHR